MTSTRDDAGGRDVVVGVDGSGASVSALRYAVAEAQQLGGGLRIIHVMPDYVGTYYPVPVADLEATGRDVVRAATTEVGPFDETLPVHTRLRYGTRVPTLVADARTAALLVVGSDRRALLDRLLTGNTSTGVAASSVAPVAVVPEGWAPEQRRGVVAVGVKEPTHAHATLLEGFELARQRGSRLLVLHAWKLPSGYDDIIAGRVAGDEWDARARAHLGGMVDRHRSSYPGVEVELRGVHDQAAHALVAASRAVDELVLVRRAHGLPAAVHLGATARTVLRESACPVRVVAPGRADVGPGHT